MFTGLVQNIGIIRAFDKSRGDLRVEIETQMNLDAVHIGASICCSGCCLTLVDKSLDCFSVDVSAETLSKTNLGAWKVMTRINIEPSLTLGDEMGGHFVSGHIDTTEKIIAINKEGDSHHLDIALPKGYEKYIASKGSIAIDGISLTVNDVYPAGFTVNIIPHSWAHTTLNERIVGDDINIEIDMLARYVARQMEFRNNE